MAASRNKDRRNSITIVGDWFSSEAISSKETANLREAIFTHHAATLHRQIEEFDREFEDLLRARNWQKENSREEAIQYLKAYLTLREFSFREDP